MDSRGSGGTDQEAVGLETLPVDSGEIPQAVGPYSPEACRAYEQNPVAVRRWLVEEYPQVWQSDDSLNILRIPISLLGNQALKLNPAPNLHHS
jgi:hypothetical protein